MKKEEVKHFLIRFLKEKKLYKKFMKNFGHWEVREDYSEGRYNDLPKNIEDLLNDNPKYWIGSAFAWEIDNERETWSELSYEWEKLIIGLEDRLHIVL